MIKTVEEAKKLECRAFGFPALITGRYGLGQFEQEYDAEPSEVFVWPRCSADECMTGWRWWDGPTEYKDAYGDGGEAAALEDEGWTKGAKVAGQRRAVHCWSRPNPNRRGYCGLAGRPEEGL